MNMTALACALVVFGMALRILPHEPNFAPIGAIALFAAVYLTRGYAMLLPLAALFVSDFFIGFTSWQTHLSVYASFLLAGGIGLLVKKKKNVATIVGGSLAGAVVFYAITNFAFFYPPVMYPHDLSGIMASYYNALPFFRNTLFSNLFYTGLLFGAYELALALSRQRAKRMHAVSAI